VQISDGICRGTVLSAMRYRGAADPVEPFVAGLSQILGRAT
jgi:hypothetical protein